MNKSRVTHLLTALAVAGSPADIHIKGFHLVESFENQRKLEIIANEAFEYKDEKISRLNKLNAKIWSEKRDVYQITGEKGDWSSSKKQMDIYGNVSFVTPDAFVFRLNRLIFDEKTQTLKSDEAINGKEEGKNPKTHLSISGEGFEAQLKKNSYKIKNKVIAKQNISREKWLVINSNTSEFEPSNNSATFEKQVKLKMNQIEVSGHKLSLNYLEENSQIRLNKFTMTGDNEIFAYKKIKAKLGLLALESKGLEIEFDQDGKNKLSRALGEVEGKHGENYFHADSLIQEEVDGKTQISMFGKVQIKTPDKVAESENAIYYPEDGHFILENGAELTSNNQKMSGERIEFSANSSEITINKARGLINKQDVVTPKKNQEGKP